MLATGDKKASQDTPHLLLGALIEITRDLSSQVRRQAGLKVLLFDIVDVSLTTAAPGSKRNQSVHNRDMSSNPTPFSGADVLCA